MTPNWESMLQMKLQFKAFKNQDDIHKLSKWSKDWQIPFNVEKCKSYARRIQQPKFWVFTIRNRFSKYGLR